MFARSDHHGRWLLATEGMLAQALPVTTDWSGGVPMTAWAQTTENISSRTALIGQAGNAMHAMVCALAILYCIGEVELAETACVGSGLASMLRRVRAGA